MRLARLSLLLLVFSIHPFSSIRLRMRVTVEMCIRDRPCTACHYCVSHCPQGLDIPSLLSLYNEHAFTGGGFIAPMALSAVSEDKRPGACLGCKNCEAVCPQQLKIAEAMADFAAKLRE